MPKHVHLGYYTIGNTMSTRYGERICELECTATIRPVFNFNVQLASMVARMVYLIWNAREIVLPGTTVLQAPSRPNRNTVTIRIFTVLKVPQLAK